MRSAGMDGRLMSRRARREGKRHAWRAVAAFSAFQPYPYIPPTTVSPHLERNQTMCVPCPNVRLLRGRFSREATPRASGRFTDEATGELSGLWGAERRRGEEPGMDAWSSPRGREWMFPWARRFYRCLAFRDFVFGAIADNESRVCDAAPSPTRAKGHVAERRAAAPRSPSRPAGAAMLLP
jgi:hypothetical protein